MSDQARWLVSMRRDGVESRVRVNAEDDLSAKVIAQADHPDWVVYAAKRIFDGVRIGPRLSVVANTME